MHLLTRSYMVGIGRKLGFAHFWQIWFAELIEFKPFWWTSTSVFAGNGPIKKPVLRSIPGRTSAPISGNTSGQISMVF